MSDRLISKSQQEMIDAQQFGEFLGDGGLGKATVKAFKDVGNKAVDYAGIQADKAAEKIASWTQDMQAAEGPDVSPLRYPHDLLEEDPCQRDLSAGSTREIMRFNIKSRHDLENRQTIYLYTPPGIALADSASYTSQEFGVIGGIQSTVSDMVTEGKLTGIDALKKMGVTAGSAGWIAAKQKFNTKLFDVGLISSGTSVNPASNLQFEGVGMRSFTFSYKMVAQSAEEAKSIRKIENLFRKFLYPSYGTNHLTLRYPPYWQIQFLKNAGGELTNNKFLPYIDLCYLRNVSVTYNSSSNAYHLDGVPIELDLSLTFDEAQQNTREDLYKESGDGTSGANYNTAEYHWKRGGLNIGAAGAPGAGLASTDTGDGVESDDGDDGSGN